MEREMPKPQELYRHFKGNLYQIITLARDSETEQLCVVYQALYGEYQVYVRPLEMFMSPVDSNKYPNASQSMRFERVDPGRSAVKQEQLQEPEAMPLQPAAEPSKGEIRLDSMLLEFLDADSYEEKLAILVGVHHRITQEMLTTMALSCDIELPEGDLEERYLEFKNCLLTLEKYECNRLR